MRAKRKHNTDIITKMDIPKERPNKWLRVLIPGVLIALWLVIAGFGGQYFSKISDLSSTDLTTFLPGSAEATKVNNELKKFRDKQTIPVLVVYNNDGKELADSDMSAIKAVGDKLAKVDGVTGSLSLPVRSDDKKAAFVVVPLASDADFVSARVADDVVAAGGVGQFSGVTLDKILSSKAIAVVPLSYGWRGLAWFCACGASDPCGASTSSTF